MAVIFTNLIDGQAVAASTFNTPMVALENAILDLRDGVGFDPQTANTLLAGPASGSASTPSFRALVADDIPALDAAKITSGIVGISRGGTGADTATIAFDHLSPLTTLGDLVGHDGSNNVRVAVGSDGQLLYADSTAAAGVRWDDPSVALGDDTTLTISSGAVTVTGGHHVVDTEGAAATDDLTTLSGMADGQVVFIRAASSDRVVTIKHAVGNIRLNGGIDFALDTPQKGVLFVASGGWVIGVGVPVTTGAGSGTVTSASLTAPVQFSVSGSPITTSGTFALAWANATANTVLAGPETGSAAAPTLRALVPADIPVLDAGKITSGIFDASQIPLLDASKITSGTIDVARIPSMDASKITSGTLGVDRIPTLTMSKISDRGMTELVAYTVLATSVSSISIPSISGTYSKLILDLRLRSDSATLSDGVSVRFNSTSALDYFSTVARIAHSATVTTAEMLGTNVGLLFNAAITGNNASSGAYSDITIEILNYANTSYAKQVVLRGTRLANTATGGIVPIIGSGYYANTGAITTMTILPGTGSVWLAGSGYALYGVG